MVTRIPYHFQLYDEKKGLESDDGELTGKMENGGIRETCKIVAPAHRTCGEEVKANGL